MAGVAALNDREVAADRKAAHDHLAVARARVRPVEAARGAQCGDLRAEQVVERATKLRACGRALDFVDPFPHRVRHLSLPPARLLRPLLDAGELRLDLSQQSVNPSNPLCFAALG